MLACRLFPKSLTFQLFVVTRLYECSDIRYDEGPSSPSRSWPAVTETCPCIRERLIPPDDRSPNRWALIKGNRIMFHPARLHIRSDFLVIVCSEVYICFSGRGEEVHRGSATRFQSARSGHDVARAVFQMSVSFLGGG